MRRWNGVKIESNCSSVTMALAVGVLLREKDREPLLLMHRFFKEDLRFFLTTFLPPFEDTDLGVFDLFLLIFTTFLGGAVEVYLDFTTVFDTLVVFFKF